MLNNLIFYPDLPLMIRSITDAHSPYAHTQVMVANDVLFLNALTEPVYYLLDCQHRDGVLDVDDMMFAFAALSNHATMLRHPMLIEGLVIVDDCYMEMAIKELSSALLGSMRLRALYSIEDALDYVREGIS